MIVRVILLFLFFSAFGVNAQSEEPFLDPFQPPLNASVPQLSQEIWDELDIPYFSQDLEINNATTDIPLALADVPPNALNNQTECLGLTNERPSYRFIWDRTNIEEQLPMRIFATSAEDLTLVIREPDGDWLCSDDYENTLHPFIELTDLRAGVYNVWVGTKTPTSENWFARLFLSIGGDNPSQPPPSCCAGLTFSNPANTGSDPVLTYIEIDEIDIESDEALLRVSVDAIFRGDSGDRFLVELFPFDTATDEQVAVAGQNGNNGCANSVSYCEEIAIRRGNEVRRDYSTVTSEPIVFDVILSDLAPIDGSLRFLLAVSQLEGDSAPEDPIIIYEIDGWNE